MDAVEERTVLTLEQREERAIKTLAILGVSAFPFNPVAAIARARVIGDVLIEAGLIDRETLEARVVERRASLLEEFVEAKRAERAGIRPV